MAFSFQILSSDAVSQPAVLRFSFGPKSRVKLNYRRVRQPGCGCRSTNEIGNIASKSDFGAGSDVRGGSKLVPFTRLRKRPEGQRAMRI